MSLDCLARFLGHALHDVARGDGAIGADVVRLRLGHLPDQGLAFDPVTLSEVDLEVLFPLAESQK